MALVPLEGAVHVMALGWEVLERYLMDAEPVHAAALACADVGKALANADPPNVPAVAWTRPLAMVLVKVSVITLEWL